MPTPLRLRSPRCRLGSSFPVAVAIALALTAAGCAASATGAGPRPPRTEVVSVAPAVPGATPLLVVRVIEPSGAPLADAVVVVVDPRQQGSFADLTDERGVVDLLSTPGAIEVAVYFGDVTVTRRIAFARDTTVTFTIDPRYAAGHVGCRTGRLPVIDYSTTYASPAPLDQRALRNLPLR